MFIHKRRKIDLNMGYDVNIVEGLKRLSIPLYTFDSHGVLFDEDKRKETIYEHIANKFHHLHVVDVQKVPEILKN